MKPLEDEPGQYSVCPLCEELIRWPEIPDRFYDTEDTLREYFAAHEAALTDHLLTHTAKVVLSDV